MTATLIASETDLRNWLSSTPTQNGNIMASFDITNSSAISNSIPTDITLEGNGNTITFNFGSDTSYSGLFSLTGGTIQNLKFTNNGTYNLIMSAPLIKNSTSSGNITNVWIDACFANKWYMQNTTSPGSSQPFILTNNSIVNFNNCLFGRDINNRLYFKYNVVFYNTYSTFILNELS